MMGSNGDGAIADDMEYMDFKAIQDQRLPEVIMCDPSEFDATWDAFVEEISPCCEV